MGQSFFRGTDAELYTGSAAFAAKISADPAAYGLQASDAVAYAALNDAYAAAYLVSQDPRTRTKAHTTGKNDARRALCRMASDLARIISAQPTVSDEQKLALGLSVRAKGSPRPASDAPTSFSVELDARGAITLKWKCANPRGTRGTMYEVWRRNEQGGEFEYLATTGQRRFVDDTLRAGFTSVTYQVRAVRSTVKGPWAQHLVNFGMAAETSTPMQNSEAVLSRIAA
jgi:hypothetical protein